MAVLVATFDADTSAVQLSIDGSTWSTVPATVTATRLVAGGSEELVRGVVAKPVIAGYLVAVDHEMPLNADVAYTVTGYSAAGAVVGSASVSVATTSTKVGIWVKAPGRPDLSVFCQIASLGEISSATIGGTYQVLDGDAVAVAQFSGVAPESFPLVLRTDVGAETDALRALLKEYRVVLLQPVGTRDMDAGWYFTGQANRSNPGGFDGFSFRYTTLAPVASRVPAGLVGGAAWTYDALLATYASYAAVKAAYPSYFAMSQGPA